MKSKSEFHREIFSKPYYGFVDGFTKTEFESAKVLGKFYTDYKVADELIKRIVDTLPISKSRTINIIDPFCGDGRLILKYFEKIFEMPEYKDKFFKISIWDIDDLAVKKAQTDIEEYCQQHNIQMQISAEITDAFVAYGDFIGTFDICITNPPWGILKPLKLFNTRCSEQELNIYKGSISAYDTYMRQEFTISQPTSKFGKWGTNLGRCGLEVALRLISKNGVCGFVSPASLFNDQVSLPFRKWIFDEFALESISYYPAKLKLYGTADVSSITVVAKKGKTLNFAIRLYDEHFKRSEQEIAGIEVENIKSSNYLLPMEFGLPSVNLKTKLNDCITLEEYCENNKLHFARELDETRLKEKTSENGRIIFAKGYMIDRYNFTADDLYLDENRVVPPRTTEFAKLVWRDVSRSSQKRRIKATVISKGHIAGNSLGVIYSEENDEVLLKALLAIINSCVFEYQARQQFVSNHVPAGVMKKMKVPINLFNLQIVSLVEEQLLGINREAEIEMRVAKLYGFSLDEFNEIINTFDFQENEIETLRAAWK